MESTKDILSTVFENLIADGVLEETDVICPECKNRMVKHHTLPDQPIGLPTCYRCGRNEYGELVNHGITTADTVSEKALRDLSWASLVKKSIFAGNPQKFFSKRFTSFKADTEELKQAGNQAFVLASESIKEPIHIMLMGDTGLGKTHLAIAMLNKIIYAENSQPSTKALFLNLAEYIDLKRIASFGDSDEVRNSVRATDYLIKTADYLVLDDLGAERGDVNGSTKATDYEASLLLKIINERDGKRLIMTTNLDSSQLANKYDQRTVSRLMEGLHVIQLTGQDYRMKQ